MGSIFWISDQMLDGCGNQLRTVRDGGGVAREYAAYSVDWCWFVLREYCWLIAGGWFVLREKYCWLVADKTIEQGVSSRKEKKSKAQN
jgi:hypothetical protein